MRKIVTPLDIALLFGKSRRPASRILASVRKELGKKPHHKITVTEFAAYFEIPGEIGDRKIHIHEVSGE